MTASRNPGSQLDDNELDRWIAYFRSELLPAEEHQLRERLAADAELRAAVLDLAAEFAPTASNTAASRQPAVPSPSPTTLSPWRRGRPLLVAAAVLIATSLALRFVLGDGAPTYEVRAEFARATQLSVLGTSDAATRGDSGSADDGMLRALPGTTLTLAVAVPADAAALFAVCDPRRPAVEWFESLTLRTADSPLGHRRYEAPEDLADRPRWLVQLVAERDFDATRVRASLLEALDRASTAAALGDELRRALGCVVAVYELRAAPRPKRSGNLEMRPEHRDLLRDARRALEDGRYDDAHRDATGLLAAAGFDADETLAASDPRWEIRDALRITQLASPGATGPATTAPWRTALQRLAELRREFALAVVRRHTDPDTIRDLHDACAAVAATLHRHLPADSPRRVQPLHLQAKIDLQLAGTPDVALPRLEQVRRHLQAIGETSHPLYGSVLNDLAGACRLAGRPERARDYALAALRACEASRADPQVRTEAARALADLQRATGDADAAERTLRRAETSLADGSAVDTQAAGERALNLLLSRAALLETGDDADREAALELLETARTRALSPELSHRRGTVLARLVHLHLIRGDLPAARAELRALHDERAVLEDAPTDLFLTGRVAKAAGELDRAAQLLSRALDAAETQTTDLADPSDRAAAAHRASLTEIAAHLAGVRFAREDTEAALSAFERVRNRSRPLPVAKRDSGQLPAAQAELDELRRRKADLHFRRDLLLARTGSAAGDDLSAALRGCHADLRELLRAEWLAERAVAAASRDVAATPLPATADALNELLGDDRALFYYAEADDGLRLLWRGPGQSALRAARLTGVDSEQDAALWSALRRLRGHLHGEAPQRAARWREDVRFLGTALVPAAALVAARRARSLMVVPAARLADLPLAALEVEDPRPDANDSSEHALLLDLLPPISYQRSLSGLRDLLSTSEQVSAWHVRPALLVGDADLPAIDRHAIEAAVFDGEKSGPAERPLLAALPETGTELELIAKLLGPRVPSVDSLVGPAATPTALGIALDGRGVVHVASHGRLGDGWRPYAAGLQLAAEDGAPFGDGLFSLGDLLDLDLRAPPSLVILSACETGRARAGRFADFTLPAVLHARGVRHVVASRWAVDSQATVHLLTAFHAALCTTLANPDAGDPAAALRLAQRQLRALHDDPRLWAAFFHSGPPGT